MDRVGYELLLHSAEQTITALTLNMPMVHVLTVEVKPRKFSCKSPTSS